MAQLYKMTLYVCDLEENLSLEEIKRLIKDDALDGISTSCVTHFANEKVGAHVDWDDDIDINYTNSTTEQWEKYFDDGEQRILCNNGKGVCPNCHRLDSIDPLARYCRYCGAKLAQEDGHEVHYGFQRKNCMCYSGKVELLNQKHPCDHQCLYCYWRHPEWQESHSRDISNMRGDT